MEAFLLHCFIIQNSQFSLFFQKIRVFLEKWRIGKYNKFGIIFYASHKSKMGIRGVRAIGKDLYQTFQHGEHRDCRSLDPFICIFVRFRAQGFSSAGGLHGSVPDLRKGGAEAAEGLGHSDGTGAALCDDRAEEISGRLLRGSQCDETPGSSYHGSEGIL